MSALDAERHAAEDRCRGYLDALMDEAGEEPLPLFEFALILLSEASRAVCDDHCSEREWVEALLQLAAVLTDNAGGWSKQGWREALGRVALRLERSEFERDVSDEILRLPEVEA